MEASRRLALKPAAGGLLVLLASLALGCRSLDRFDTSGAPAYCGSIVGASLFQEGFIPENERPSLRLALELDTDRLTTRPGSLRSDDGEQGLCADSSGALFQDAPLRAIESIFDDALSQADFGDGHQHDFFAWIDSSCRGTMLAVVSLLTNGAVELRLLKPAPDPSADAPAEDRPGFALFYLRRSETGCGF